MASDPLANMVERLRGRGCQPRKVGHDLWESKCPGHGSGDHALALARGADGKLQVTCRSIENCSLSRIVKKLDLKLDRLFAETQPSLIRRLRALEIQPSIYSGPAPAVPVAGATTDADAGNEPGADLSAAASPVRNHEMIENAEGASDASAATAPGPRPAVDEGPGPAVDEGPGPAVDEGPRPAVDEGPGPAVDEGPGPAVDEGPGPAVVNEGPGPGVDEKAKVAGEVVLSLEDAGRGGRASAAATTAGNATVRGETRASAGCDELLKIAGGARTFRRPDGGYSLSRPVDNHAECHDLDSPDVRRWLTRAYYDLTGRLPSPSALASTLFALAAHADMNRVYDSDFVRVGRNESGSSTFLDLGDPTWRAVEINATGWQVVPRPDVHFRRSQGQLALPTPSRDGALARLRRYINVDYTDLPLLIGWITAALRPFGPHPILVITGEQGSAKSTLARVCRLLTDPHTAPLRAEPREHRDLMVAALNGWVQAYDNISGLPDWLSNGLCRLVTGGGISIRGLYTNHQEVVWSAQRPIILNGITDFVQRPDVLDRSVCIQLRPITTAHRRCEQEFWADFTADYPKILGGILDAVASGMRLLPAIKLPELERMADFTRWGEAVAQAVGWPPGTFVSAYRGNRRAASVTALEESQLGEAIISLNKYHGAFKGTMTQLLGALAGYTGSCRLTVPGWPKTPNVAATELRRIAPLLRIVGVSVTFERGPNGNRLIAITSTNRDDIPTPRRA